MTYSIKPSTISKAFFLTYIVYNYILIYSIYVFKGFSALLIIFALLFQLIANKFRLQINKSIVFYFVFLIYILASGFIVSVDKDRMLQTSFTYFEYLLIFYLVIAYSKDDKKVDFPINVFVFHGLIAAVVMVLRGVGIAGIRARIADNVNSNITAITLSFSIAFILYEIIEHKKTPITISISAILFILFSLLMTVSKKGIISGIAFIVLWLICCYKSTFKHIKLIYKVILVVAVIGLSIFSIIWFRSNYASQIEYIQFRMSQISTSMSSRERVQLFKEGIVVFIDHPILGVGFNNVRYFTSYNTYTHCFYSELLSATGIVGTMIFICPIIFTWNKIIRYFKNLNKDNNFVSVKCLYMIIIFVLLMVISITQIIFYIYNLMFVLAILSGFAIELSHNK